MERLYASAVQYLAIPANQTLSIEVSNNTTFNLKSFVNYDILISNVV